MMNDYPKPPPWAIEQAEKSPEPPPDPAPELRPARAALTIYEVETGLDGEDDYRCAVTRLVTDLLKMTALIIDQDEGGLGLPSDPLDILRDAEKRFRHYQETGRPWETGRP